MAIKNKYENWESYVHRLFTFKSKYIVSDGEDAHSNILISIFSEYHLTG